MRRKAIWAIFLSLLLIGGGAAVSLDTFIDTAACSMSMATPFMGAACTVATFDDIISGGPEDVQNDIYTKTAFVSDARERVNLEQRSQLNQTYGIAMSDAKLEIIKGLNNGLSKSKARQNASAEVQDLYSSYEMRVIAQQNREALKLNETLQKIGSTSGVTLADVYQARRAKGGYGGSPSFNFAPVNDIRVTESNYTLFNGTTTSRPMVEVKIRTSQDTFSGTSTVEWVDFTEKKEYELFGKADGGSENTKYVDTVLRAVNTDGDFRHFVNGTKFLGTLDRIGSRYDSASNTVLNLSDNVFSNYQAGDVNVSSVCGPLCSLRNAATNYQDTGAYSYLAYSLYQMGLASDAATAFELTIPSRNLSETTGQLFLETEAWSNTTIETGETYNASGKPAWFVYKPDGSPAEKISLSGNFTVNELWNTRNSTQIDSTTVQSSDFHTKSTEDLQKQINNSQRRIDLMVELPETTGGTGGFGSLNPFQIGLGASLFVILALLLVVGGATLA